MDEVDKIIIHSLKQIGFKMENDDGSEIFRLKHFTPGLLVKAVSTCLQEISRDTTLPNAMPENIAHRFTVATSLAEMCRGCGYRGDIGYQTFLYPNEVDIRRLFMFLIEQFPKEQISSPNDSYRHDKSDFELLMTNVRKEILLQLKSAWVPQYCRAFGSRKPYVCSGLGVHFFPQVNLKIPKIEKSVQSEESSVVTYQLPNIFQQTCNGDYDLISSVLHQNSIEMCSPSGLLTQDVPIFLARPMQPIIISPTRSLFKSNEIQGNVEKKGEISMKTPLEDIAKEIESINLQNQQAVKGCQMAKTNIIQIRQNRLHTESLIEDMKKKYKIHERTLLIMENPEENISKLENLIEKARERHLAVENQWQIHRNTSLKQIDDLKRLRQSKNQQSIHEVRSTIQQLQTALVEKNQNHKVLEEELKKSSNGVALRKEYTKRIYEFIGNIRKQRNDIYKILDDTKDLQKQLNSVAAQLRRQFNYTDDLLFQSAKHDLHAKQAYKLLASLHASCNEICDLVSRTGQMTKESRDLEVQIDQERMRNVGASLENITLDIQKFEIIIKSMKSEINQVENEIHLG